MERIKSKFIGNGTREIVMLESTNEIRERWEVYDSGNGHTYEFNVIDFPTYEGARLAADDKFEELTQND